MSVNEENKQNPLFLLLIFVAGFTVFTFIGFVILGIMLSLGILPAF